MFGISRKNQHIFFCLTFIILTAIDIYDKGVFLCFSNKLKWLTNWGLSFTFVYFLSQIFNLLTESQTKDLLAILMSYNSVITVFYWCFIHEIKPEMTPLTIPQLYTDHIYPLVSSVIEFVQTDYEMEDRQLRYIFAIISVYIVQNMVWTFATGVPVYDIVTWVNAFSYAFVASFVGGLYFFFKLWQKIRRWGNQQNLKSKKINY